MGLGIQLKLPCLAASTRACRVTSPAPVQSVFNEFIKQTNGLGCSFVIEYLLSVYKVKTGMGGKGREFPGKSGRPRESESWAREKGLLQELAWHGAWDVGTQQPSACLRRGHWNSGHSEAWQRRVRKGHSDNPSAVMGDEPEPRPGQARLRCQTTETERAAPPTGVSTQGPGQAQHPPLPSVHFMDRTCSVSVSCFNSSRPMAAGLEPISLLCVPLQ